MKLHVQNYTFNHTTHAITFTDYASIRLDSVLFVENATRGVIYFVPGDATLGGTVATNVLTLTYDSSGHADADKLLIYYDTGPGTATKANSDPVVLASDQVSVPSWTDATSIVAITTLAKGAVSTTAFAVTAKFGAFVYVFIGRTGTTALDQSIHVRIRRLILANPVIRNLVPEASFESNKTASVSGVCAGSGNNAGVTTLTLNAAKTFVAGLNGEIWLAVLDSTSTPTSASEWVRQSLATSTTAKLLDAPTISAHNSTSHNVADQADIFRAYIPGGATYELVIDYGQATTGDTVVIQALMQTLDSVAVA